MRLDNRNVFQERILHELSNHSAEEMLATVVWIIKQLSGQPGIHDHQPRMSALSIVVRGRCSVLERGSEYWVMQWV